MRGVVAAGSDHAAEAGRRAFEEGGNAVDAAVAAMVTAFIAEPCLTSPGGSGIAVLYDRETDTARTFDFFAQVPGLPGRRVDAAGRDFVPLEVDFGSDTTQVFHVGKAATAVPGCLPGLLELHRGYGGRPLRELLARQEEEAARGLPASKAQAHFFEILEPILTYSEGLAKVFAPAGRILRPGELVRSRRWAQTLRWVRENGRDPLTDGCLRDELLEAWGAPEGLITADDLDDYTTGVHDARRVRYRDHEVLLPGFPSVGGAMVGFALELLEPLPPAADPRCARHYGMVAAALETAMRARAEGPPVTAPGDLDHWLAPEHVERYRPTFEALLEEGGPGHGRDAGHVPGNTTHVSTVDAHGMSVSITTSNGESCGVLLPGLGLGMNNFLGEEDINPRGWHAEPPGRRLSTMMCPTVVRDARGRLLSLGTGGSNRIRSAILQVLLAVLDHDLDPEAAIHHPRVHRELDGAFLEAQGLPEESVAEVRRLFPGVRVFPERAIFFGGVHMAICDAAGELSGAGDPRRDGHLAVFEG